MARPLPKMKAPAFRKNSEKTVGGRDGQDQRGRPASKEPRRRLPRHHDETGGHEEQRDLRPGDRRHDADGEGDDPQACVLFVGESSELDRGDGEHSHYRGGDAVEKRLDRLQPLELHVDHRYAQDQEERWKDEWQDSRQGSERASLDISDPHDYLCRERPRHGLAERHSVQELFARHPLPALHQVPLHVADRGDGAAESPCAQPEEVPDELPERRPVTRWVGRVIPRDTHRREGYPRLNAISRSLRGGPSRVNEKARIVELCRRRGIGLR